MIEIPEENSDPSASTVAYPSLPAVMWAQCPISTTMGTLGRKWTVPILRDVAFFPKASFGLIRKCNPGLRQRTLSLRLRQLAAQNFIRRVVPPDDRQHPYYELTAKGMEVWPILTSLLQFGIRHYADVVFEDQQPRSIEEIYPYDAALMLGSLTAFARSAEKGVAASYARPASPIAAARGSTGNGAGGPGAGRRGPRSGSPRGTAGLGSARPSRTGRRR
jgi:DNA-binding HxlR family transcriptional regulator